MKSLQGTHISVALCGTIVHGKSLVATTPTVTPGFLAHCVLLGSFINRDNVAFTPQHSTLLYF